MAANKANICTNYVTYDQEISQPVSKSARLKQTSLALEAFIQFLFQKGYSCDFPVGGSDENLTAAKQAPVSDPAASQSLISQKFTKTLICTSCAKATRGKYKLVRLMRNQNFSCYMGKSKDKTTKQYGGFKYLTNKVDLSSAEAENSFKRWLTQFNK